MNRPLVSRFSSFTCKELYVEFPIPAEFSVPTPIYCGKGRRACASDPVKPA